MTATQIMVEWAIQIGLVLMLLGIALSLVRLIRGPGLWDRALAADTIAVLLIGFVILLAMRIHSLMLVDGVLVLSLLGFAGTVAVGQFIIRRHVRRKLRLQKGLREEREWSQRSSTF